MQVKLLSYLVLEWFCLQGYHIHVILGGGIPYTVHVKICLLPSKCRLGSGNDDTAFSYICGFTGKGENWKGIKTSLFPMYCTIINTLHSCSMSNKKSPQEIKEKHQS